MRLLGADCGCDTRKEIMWERGNLGITEAGVIAMAALALLITYNINAKQ